MRQHALNSDHPWLKADPLRLAVYNSHDGIETAKLIPHMQAELAARPGNDTFYAEEVWPTIKPLLAMMDRGIPIDLAERTRLRRSFRAEVRACDEVICRAANQPFVDAYTKTAGGFNPNSDTQIRRWLFGGDRTTAPPGTPVEVAKGTTLPCLGLKPTRRTDGGAWSVAQDALLSVLGPSNWRKMDEPHRPLLHALLHRSRFVKLDEYLDFETDDRGDGPRVYPTIKPFGTKSLRLAYADPAVHSWATELRTMVAARPGHLFVGADYSQIEARIPAYLSGDESDIAIYEQNPDDAPYPHDPAFDIHSATVLECFKMTEADWKGLGAKRKLYRDWAKVFRYGCLLYGGEPETAKTKTFCPCPKCSDKVPDTLDLTRTELRRLTDAWFARHHHFSLWRNKLLNAFGPHGTRSIKMPSGWRSPFIMPWSNDLRREAFNRPIQHTAAFIIMRAERRLHALECPLILQHHDSLIAEVLEGEAKYWRTKMVEAMQHPIELAERKVVFPVEAKIGRTWADL